MSLIYWGKNLLEQHVQLNYEYFGLCCIQILFYLPIFFMHITFLLTSYVIIFSASHSRIGFPYLFSLQQWAKRVKNVRVCVCACVASGVYTCSGHFTPSLFHPPCFMWSAVVLQTWPAPCGKAWIALVVQHTCVLCTAVWFTTGLLLAVMKRFHTTHPLSTGL